MSIPQDEPIRLADGYRFQWENTRKTHVLLYPEGMVNLNVAAGEILKRCDGTCTPNDIIDDLNRQFPDANLGKDVMEFLETAHGKGWITGA